MQISNVRRAIGLMAILAGSSMTSGAVPISWNTALISGASDVNKQGTLLDAWSFGNNTTPVINGVSFLPASLTFQQQQNASTFVGGDIEVTDPSSSSVSNFGNPPTLASGSDYASLTGHAFVDVNTQTLMTLDVSLTVGHTYVLQLWVNDSRQGLLTTEPIGITDGDAPSAITINADVPYPGGAGNGGEVATGTFTATLDLARFSFSYNYNNLDFAPLNALQLRDTTVPEPSSFLLAGVGTAGSLRRRRR